MKHSKKSKLALISMVLGALYLVYIVYYFSNGMVTASDSTEVAGTGLATMLVLPHILCTGIALLFNILGYIMNRPGFMLTAGILYAVAMVLFLIYFMFVIIQMVLSFIAYAKMKKAKEESTTL